MSITHGMIAYDVVTGEILRFIPSDISITPELTASVHEKLKNEISTSFYISPASPLMCKYFSMKLSE